MKKLLSIIVTIILLATVCCAFAETGNKEDTTINVGAALTDSGTANHVSTEDESAFQLTWSVTGAVGTWQTNYHWSTTQKKYVTDGDAIISYTENPGLVIKVENLGASDYTLTSTFTPTVDSIFSSITATNTWSNEALNASLPTFDTSDPTNCADGWTAPSITANISFSTLPTSVDGTTDLASVFGAFNVVVTKK